MHILQNCFRSRWRHKMETFSTLLALCVGNSTVTSEIPSQRPVMRSFDFFLWSAPEQRLSIQSRRWWFEMPSCSLWRHCNDDEGCTLHKLAISILNCFHIITYRGRQIARTKTLDIQISKRSDLPLHHTSNMMYRICHQEFLMWSSKSKNI